MDKGKTPHVRISEYDYVVGEDCMPQGGIPEHIKFTERDDSVILENGKKPSTDWKSVASVTKKHWSSCFCRYLELIGYEADDKEKNKLFREHSLLVNEEQQAELQRLEVEKNG